jgi:phosphotriesterase-related protein
MKKAMTVLGPLNEDRLGHILPHEHFLMKFPETGIVPLYPDLLDQKVTMDMLGRLRRHIWTCRDNMRLDDEDTAAQETASFKSHGGGTIVDVTSMGLGRNMRSILEIAHKTDVNIIAGTGWYTAASHSTAVSEATVETLQRWMVDEVTVGIEGTPARAGIIGEIGISTIANADEEKVLRAAARAHRETGAPLSVHQTKGHELKWIDSVLVGEGVRPENVILCHMCSTDSVSRLWAADRGYYTEIDSFGHEYFIDVMAGVTTRDPDRVEMVKELIGKGHLRQVLISNNVSLKMLLKKYGGWGYEHIIVNMKPFMLRAGIPPKAVDTMIYYNPARVVAYLK